MTAIERLQAYLRYSATQDYRTVPVPPFTAFIQANDPLTFFNYAIPDHPIDGADREARESLDVLIDVFRRANRRPRFEFIGEYAPQLATLLESAGFTEEATLPLMLCTPTELRMPPAPEGVTITQLDAHSSDDLAIAHSRIAYQSFGMTGDWTEDMNMGIPAEKAQAVAQQKGLFVAELNGEAVAVATYSTPYDGIVELGGVATLATARQRGIGAYISAVATAAAFDQGVTLVLLSAGDDGATRVYERIGFRTGATTVAYWIQD